jgi:serine acetyltransferase
MDSGCNPTSLWTTIQKTNTEHLNEGHLLKLIKEDIEVAIEKDPAARNFWEVVLLYPGVHALIGYRLAHVLWGLKLNFLASRYPIKAWTPG